MDEKNYRPERKKESEGVEDELNGGGFSFSLFSVRRVPILFAE